MYAAHGTADKWTTATAASLACVFWNTFSVPVLCTIVGVQRRLQGMSGYVWMKVCGQRYLEKTVHFYRSLLVSVCLICQIFALQTADGCVLDRRMFLQELTRIKSLISFAGYSMATAELRGDESPTERRERVQQRENDRATQRPWLFSQTNINNMTGPQ